MYILCHNSFKFEHKTTKEERSLVILNTVLKKSISKKDISVFVHIIKMVTKINDHLDKTRDDRGSLIFRCHSLCRALAHHDKKITVQDGHYIGVAQKQNGRQVSINLHYADHSWLVLPCGSIVDPYPVGFITTNPVLIAANGKYSPFGAGLYVSDKNVGKKVMTPAIIKETKILIAFFRTALRKVTPK